LPGFFQESQKAAVLFSSPALRNKKRKFTRKKLNRTYHRNDPWLLDSGDTRSFCRPFAARHRRGLLAHASGEVLRIGFGSGFNLPHCPARVRKITTGRGVGPDSVLTLPLFVMLSNSRWRSRIHRPAPAKLH
jgi:hypothetical protein